jgi:hypothetical protein
MSFGDEVAEKMAGLGEGVYKAPDRERIPGPGGDSHYLRGGIEPVDFILTNFPEGYKVPVMEYVFRAGKKADVPEAVDIQKAIWWLNKRLKQLEGA